MIFDKICESNLIFIECPYEWLVIPYLKIYGSNLIFIEYLIFDKTYKSNLIFIEYLIEWLVIPCHSFCMYFQKLHKIILLISLWLFNAFSIEKGFPTPIIYSLSFRSTFSFKIKPNIYIYIYRKRVFTCLYRFGIWPKLNILFNNIDMCCK